MKKIIFIMLLLAGCASPSVQMLQQKKINSIQPGITTEADLFQLFGKPRSESVMKGKRVLAWDRTQAGGWIAKNEMLSVMFAPDGTVERYVVTRLTW